MNPAYASEGRQEQELVSCRRQATLRYKSLQLVTAPQASSPDTRLIMSTGNPLLDNLLVGAVFVWIFYWILALTLKPREKREKD